MTTKLCPLGILLTACATSQGSSTTELTEDLTTCASTVDYSTDPLNCGTCGNVCASGLCYWGTCADDRAGQMFVIGNSYRKSNPSWDRALGNAVFINESAKVNVLVYRGTAPADVNTGAQAALGRAATMLHRSLAKTVITNSAAVQTSLPAMQVLVVEAQPQLDDFGLSELADEWQIVLDDFTRGGGIVIVMDAPSAKNHGTAQVLGQLMPMHESASIGTLGTVAIPGDQAVGRVPLMFALAESVGYTAPSGFIDAAVSDSGAVLVAHRSVE